MEDSGLHLPVDVIPFHNDGFPDKPRLIKSVGDSLLILSSKDVVIYHNYTLTYYNKEFKDIFIGGDIDKYGRCVICTSDFRIKLMRPRDLGYDEIDVNFFLPTELKQRKCRIGGVSIYHVESFEIRVLVYTTDKSIFMLSFFTNQTPINAKSEVVYVTTELKGFWSSFGTVETADSVVVFCSDNGELGRIIFDRRWNGNYEKIERMEFKQKSDDFLSVLKDEEGYNVVWNTGELDNVGLTTKKLKYRMSVSYDNVHKMTRRSNVMKPFEKEVTLSSYIISLKQEGTELIDEESGRVMKLWTEGKSKWMCGDGKTVWVLTESNLYRIFEKSESRIEELKNIEGLECLSYVRTDEEVLKLIENEYEVTQSSNLKKRVVLYCMEILIS
ncbi:hypothetical protein EIN_249590, partial [Entamoeba invadens IP1]